MKYRFLFEKAFIFLIILAASALSYPVASAQAISLEVTKITQSVSIAIADGTFPHGWKWIFDITVPESETVFKMRFDNLTSGTNSILAGGNIRFYSDQSGNGASSPILIGSAGSYSDPLNIISSADLDSAKAGRQIQVTVETKVPSGTPAGSYSGNYGINTSAPASPLPLNVVSVASIPDTNVALGTPLGSLALPSRVNVFLSDGSAVSALIAIWSGDATPYNGDVPGTYQFFGTLVLPPNVSNTRNQKALARFMVGNPSLPSNESSLNLLTVAYNLNNVPQTFPFNEPVSLLMTLPLPAGVTSLPVLSATAKDPGANVAITQISSLPGTATVVVTARDGVAKNTYTVNFTGSLVSAPALSSISVSPSGFTLFAGQTRALSASGRDQFGDSFALSEIVWSSDHPEFATVDQTGLVTAVSLGSAVITAESGGKTGGATVTVSVPGPGSSDATLSSFTVTYGTIFHGSAEFTSTVPASDGRLSYSLGLMAGTNRGTVTAVPNNLEATVTVANPSSLPGTAVIEVVSKDGTARNIYTIDLQVQGQ